jgi:anti-anti-sigma regulatory factor
VHAIVNASARARQRGRRLVVLRGPPDVDRVFSLTGSAGDVESGDVEPVEPSVQALLRRDARDGRS